MLPMKIDQKTTWMISQAVKGQGVASPFKSIGRFLADLMGMLLRPREFQG